MSGESPTEGEGAEREPRWPWLVLALALVWAAVVRAPLVLNARVHLDSDLAVDGIVLQEALRGHWPWHYPGTPYMGTPPVLLSLPQAALIGATPEALVSGGVVAWLLLMVGTFLAARAAFGGVAAALSLVPLAFSSTGAIWLSGRITGGHLLTAAWFAGALGFLATALGRGTWKRTLVLGIWCGLGLYLDRMAALGVGGIAVALGRAWLFDGATARSTRLGFAATWAAGIALGIVPLVIGRLSDPYDAYPGQFATIVEAADGKGGWGSDLTSTPLWMLAADHARRLGLDCLPRLLVGHRLPDLESDPAPHTLGVFAGFDRLDRNGKDPLGLLLCGLVLPAVLLAAQALALAIVRGESRAARGVGLACFMTSIAVALGFILNLHIYNSDNYRYLVLWLPAWGIGLGLALDKMRKLDGGGLAATGLLVLAMAAMMTVDTARWYRGFRWLDGWTPVRREHADPLLACLEQHPEIQVLRGDYWDVYRLMFLTGGRVVGVPMAGHPNRFEEWSQTHPSGLPEHLLMREGPSRRWMQVWARMRGELVCEVRGKRILTLPPGWDREP